jgi:hypothetical protein
MSRHPILKKRVRHVIIMTLAGSGIVLFLGSMSRSPGTASSERASISLAQSGTAIPHRHEAISSAGTSTAASTAAAPDQTARARVNEDYGRLPLRFEPNQGHVDSRVRFLSRGSGYNLFLTPDEAVLSLSVVTQPPSVRGGIRSPGGYAPHDAGLKRATLRMKPIGGSPNPAIRGLEELAGRSNVFIGGDRKSWREGIRGYGRVEYRDVYPGVDLTYYGNQRQLEYDFVVSPGADPSSIRLKFDGADRMMVDESGDLVLSTPVGDVHQHKPLVYQ